MSAFADNFWGDRCNGFDILYHNMKCGHQSSKDLIDFLRESCTAEETYAKLLTKLAKFSGNNNHQGSFTPFWVVLKALAEKLSTLHMQLVLSWQELIKDVQKYYEEQHKKHKQIKDSEASTLESVNCIQQTLNAVAKTQESYHARFHEYEKSKRDSSNQKDWEKAEVKCKKAREDYKNNVDKLCTVKVEYEKKMTSSCQVFEREEDIHLKQMKNFVDTYTKAWEHQHALIGQVHTEFKVNCSDLSIRKLKNTFINNKTTGTERLNDVSFQEPTPSAYPPVNSGDSSRDIPMLDKPTRSSGGEEAALPNLDISPSRGGGLPSWGNLRFLSKSKREKKKVKKGKKKDDKRESSESPGKDAPAVDEEGFSIRPDNPFENEDRQSWYSSSDSESDSEDRRKIKVEIKPYSPHESVPSNNVDDLKRSIEGLRLSPSAMRKTNSESTLRKSTSASDSIGKTASGHDLLGLDSFLAPTPAPPAPVVEPSVTSSPLDIASSRQRKQGANTPTNIPPLSLPPPISHRGSHRGNLPPAATARPTGRQSPASVFDRADSVPGLNSVTFNTTSMPVGSSRGPSPLTIGMSDTIPLAVSFSEICNAFLKVDDNACRLKMTGDLMLSFPAGIVRVITENPNPTMLSFKVTNATQIHQILLNKQLLSQDMLKSTADVLVYSFDMPALLEHLRKQSETNRVASYFNIDILKYQLKADHGMDHVPLQLVTYWKCDEKQTDFRLDYKYNSSALSTPMPLSKLSVILPVNGDVTNMQAQPNATWNSAQNRAVWKLGDVSVDKPDGSLRAKFDLSAGPSTPCPTAVQFVTENTTLSGVDFELNGPGYRMSLVKKRVITGKYLSDSDTS